MTQPVDETLIRAAAHDLRDDEIDLRELLGVLIDGKWIIAAVTALALLAGVAYLLIAPPVYQADALIQVENQEAGLSSAFGDMAALLGQQSTAISGEIELLRSRMVVGQAVANLRLDIQARPKHFPVIGQAIARRHKGMGVAEPWLGLDSYAWGGEVIEVSTFEVPDEFLGKTFTLVLTAPGEYALRDPGGAHVLDGRIGELQSRRTPVGDLKLFVTDLQGRVGTRFELTRFAPLTAITELQQRLRVSEKGKQSNMIGMSLEGTDRALTTAIVNEIANIYVRQNVERKSAEAEQTLEFLERQLPLVKNEMHAAEAALNSYRNQMGSVDLDKEAGAILQQMVQAEHQRTQLQQKREELIRRFTPAHPTVVAVDAQIADLDGVLGELDQRVRSLPQTQQEIVRLARDAQVNTELYTALLNNYQQLQVAKAGTIGNVRVVDHAALPVEPVRPQAVLVLAVAVILGLFLGAIVILLRRALQAGVEDPDVLEQRLGLSVYATVPHSRTQAKLSRQMRKGSSENLVLAVREPEDPAVESLRNLRTALHFATMGAKNNMIMLTGPAPDIGKSFVGVNLGAVLASTGAKVLLIDADMRKGYLHQYVGLTREDGLSELISGMIEPAQAVRATAVPGLYLLPTGALPPNPSELLLSEQFGFVLERLVEQYDHVIVDSPPVLAVTDAAIVGRLSGTVLMVLKAGAHPIREIDHSVKRLRQAGVNLKGLLLNDIKAERARYRYQYSYQYSYKKL